MKIPAEMLPILKQLAAKGVLGNTVDQVATHLLRMGFDHVITTEYVRKFIEQRKLLRDG